jgi:hypothetical protein
MDDLHALYPRSARRGERRGATMAAHSPDRHVEIEQDGRVVRDAEVRPLPDHSVVRAELHVESGHLPVGTGAALVDAVLDLPESREGSKLEATLPIGDSEPLERLRERCETVDTRTAGASCLVDATLPADPVDR